MSLWDIKSILCIPYNLRQRKSCYTKKEKSVSICRIEILKDEAFLVVGENIWPTKSITYQLTISKANRYTSSIWFSIRQRATIVTLFKREEDGAAQIDNTKWEHNVKIKNITIRKITRLLAYYKLYCVTNKNGIVVVSE